MKLFLISIMTFLMSCQSAPVAISSEKAEEVLQWLKIQEVRSWNHLQKNINPTLPKGQIKPVPGAIVAALSQADPDYYFHWVRDSSLIMQAVADASVAGRKYANRDFVQSAFGEYLKFSERLQLRQPLGEPRFNVNGTRDRLPWSRPQYDGPALRAIALIKYLQTNPSEENRARAEKIIKKDLDFTVKSLEERGFDIWEELRAENFHTRLVQVAALEQGARIFNRPEYARRAGMMERELDKHWDSERKILKSQLVIEATDGYTKKKTDVDSAVILAVIDSARDSGPFSPLDPRVQATVHTIETYFRSRYIINNGAGGLAYGRYPGDAYYGGNPWFLVTAYFAQFYFKLSLQLKAGEILSVTSDNILFWRSFKRTFQLGDNVGESLSEDVRLRGVAILERIRQNAGPDGQLSEQFDQVTGRALSSHGLGWAHASLIESAIAAARH